jgi:hypothetical protein
VRDWILARAVFWRERVENGFSCVENGFFVLPALGVKRRAGESAVGRKPLLGMGLELLVVCCWSAVRQRICGIFDFR